MNNLVRALKLNFNSSHANIWPKKIFTILVCDNFSQIRPVIISSSVSNKSAAELNSTKDVKAKTRNLNKITLLTQNQAFTVTTLEEAAKIAKRRDLKLVLVQEIDSKTHRPVYKLVSQADLVENEFEDLKENAECEKDSKSIKKSEKSLTIGSRISDHDLMSRLKNISKWLTKQHEVRILLQGSSEDDMANCERIAKMIEDSVKEPVSLGKIVQKRAKGTNIKFSILPLVSSDSKKVKNPS